MALPTSNTVVKADGASQTFGTAISGHTKTTELQSFQLDNTTGYLWTLQTATHETAAPYSGNLTLTRLQSDGSGGWATKDHMDLTGFGHGIAFGVEYISGATPLTYIWVETNNNPSSGYGRGIARFHYNPGATLSASSVTTMVPVAGVSGYSCVVRTGSGVIVVRYSSGADRFYQAYNLADATNNNWSSPLTPNPVPEPSVVTAATQQGWTFQGEFLYMLDGMAGQDVYVTSLDLNLTHNTTHSSDLGTYKSYITRARKNVDASASPREPEGVSFDTRGSAYNLLFGLTNYTSTAHASDLFSVSDTVVYP